MIDNYLNEETKDEKPKTNYLKPGLFDSSSEEDGEPDEQNSSEDMDYGRASRA